MTITEQNESRGRINQALAWLYVMDGECKSRKEWRKRIYYLLLYVGGLMSEKDIQEKVLKETVIE